MAGIRFKLEKLKILAYSNAKRTKPVGEFEAMFNPASLKRSYQIVWGMRQGQNSAGTSLHYARSKPDQLTLHLTLDGTGVSQIGTSRDEILHPQSVSARIRQFLDVAYEYNGRNHEPNYLVVKWGDEKIDCRLWKVDITHEMFDRDGKPLRAILAVTLLSDEEAARLAKKQRKQSPDLTHRRLVCDGDTLPLLTKEIYGSSAYYVDVARFNGLDDFRRLIPGTELRFPPLAELRSPPLAPLDKAAIAAVRRLPR